MTQGTHNHSRLASIVDLDELLAKRSLAPVPVKLGGTTYSVRTDLTAAESNHVLSLMKKHLDAQGFTLVVGSKPERVALLKAIAASEGGEPVDLPAGRMATKLNEYIDSLPQIHQALVTSRILSATRVLAEFFMSEADINKQYGLQNDDEEPAEQGESSAS